MRSRSRTAAPQSRRFFLGYRSIVVLVAVGAGTIVMLAAECRARRAPRIEKKAFLERDAVAAAEQ